jgi:hypothetical protein
MKMKMKIKTKEKEFYQNFNRIFFATQKQRRTKKAKMPPGRILSNALTEVSLLG